MTLNWGVIGLHGSDVIIGRFFPVLMAQQRSRNQPTGRGLLFSDPNNMNYEGDGDSPASQTG